MADLSDFNDLAATQGAAVVRTAIQKAKPVVEEWPDPVMPTPDGEQAEAYPIHVLPEALRQAALEVARFVKVPVASPAVIGLSVAAIAIGKKARIEERPGLYHHPSLFHVLVAESGERKSPPFKIMTSPLETWVEMKSDLYQRDLAKAQAERSVIEGLIANLKRRASDPKTGDDERTSLIRRMAEEAMKQPNVPPSLRTFTTDTTEERLFQKLHDHDGAYAVLSGEGRPVLDAVMGKYSGKNRTGDAVYLAGTSGDTITRDRVGNENGPEDRAIINPCLNVCIMVQPDKYLEVATHPSLRASGALARIWSVRPPSLVGTRIEEADEPGLDEAALHSYQQIILHLLSAPMPEYLDTGKPMPHLVRLSREVQEARREWHNIIERMMGPGESLEDVRDLAAKAVSTTCKAAMTLHFLHDPGLFRHYQSELSLATWRDAQLLGEYHLGEAIRMQREADEDAIHATAKRVLAWVLKQQRLVFSLRELQQYGPRPRLNERDALQVLVEMSAMGWIRQMSPVGQERVSRFEVNPKLVAV